MTSAADLTANAAPNRLEWSDDLAMGLADMDQTHREFIDLLVAVQTAPDAQALARWRELVAHTEDHFAREDRWMQDTAFAASNCHTSQHQYVLQVLREGTRLGETGDLAPLRQMSQELVAWFPMHASAMDHALAQHLGKLAYDTASGQIGKPEILPKTLIHGCASSACSEPEYGPGT